MPTDVVTTNLSEQTVELVRAWLHASGEIPQDPAGRRLAELLRDPDGLAFAVGFIDGVIRPEDPRVAARNFARLARRGAAFLPWHLRAGVRLGGWAAPLAPHLVVPVARRVLRSMVGHLVIDARDATLGRSIRRIRSRGVRLNVNLLGEAVLGSREADKRLAGTMDLLRRPDVDYVSVKVSSVVAPHSVWAFEETVAHVVERLTPLYELAASATPPKFVNLDMEEYRDLDLTVEVFTALLDQPRLRGLEAGIVLQAYLPDAVAAMRHLQEWAAARRAEGGARIKVRVVKGANLPMERVEAEVHGWPLATWGSKAESDANYKRVLDYALDPRRIENLRVGVAGHNLFDLAHAWLLAGERGVRDGVEFEMLLGMAQGQAEVVRREVGGLLLYTPVVHRGEFDVAIAYLVRRLEEGASSDNFMSAVFDLDDPALFAREEERFRASLALVDDSVPAPHRDQDRTRPEPHPDPEAGFAQSVDTDPSVAANRAWARGILGRVPASRLGAATVAERTVRSVEEVDALLEAVAGRAPRWQARSGSERARVLEDVAHSLEIHRADLLEVMAAETGKTLDQGDPEVSEAIDFARYYAGLARELDEVDGARFVPASVTLVTPPWNFPVAIPAGSVLAALAAGSAVVIKPAPQALRCAAVMVEALWEAGVPREVLRYVNLDEGDLGRHLLAHPRVDRVILTGSYETAELFRSFRPDLPLLAETSGKNAIVVTPGADLDLAARDLVQSAFGHAGQKCSAASLGILVGSVATSRRFRGQLLDAVSSLTVGSAEDPRTRMGPLVEPARGKLLEAFTTLGPGESWLVRPRKLDDDGRLWSPGVREGVRRGSAFHTTEYFGPVLGLIAVDTLEEAIAVQNEVDYGLTAGLHSLDAEEIGPWLASVEAGNLYVNRGITGAIVRRQPFGGWKRSVVGPGAKAGGPNYLTGLGSWVPAPSRPLAVESSLPEKSEELLGLARELGLPAEQQQRLERALRDDATLWATEFGVAKDVSGLAAERNVFRYRPRPVQIHVGEGAGLGDVLRVLGAGRLAGGELAVTSLAPLPGPLAGMLAASGIGSAHGPVGSWAATLPPNARLRIVGTGARDVVTASGGRPDVAIHDHEVTGSGRVELLPFLAEQAISITAHRFGTPDHLTDDLLWGPEVPSLIGVHAPTVPG